MTEPRNRDIRQLARERAEQFRSLARSHRHQAAAEPLERRRRLLAASARRYEQLALAEERISGEDGARDRPGGESAGHIAKSQCALPDIGTSLEPDGV